MKSHQLYFLLFVSSFTIFLFCTPSYAFSQNQDSLIIISPRIGALIDQQERDYFCLFPKIKNFVSAQILKNGMDHFSVIIKHKIESKLIDSMVSINKEIFEQLQRFIETYEECAIEFNSEPDLDVRGTRYFSKSEYQYRLLERKDIIQFQKLGFGELTKTFIVTSSGKQTNGILLYANDSLIILWKCGEDYDWKRTDSCLNIVSVKNILPLNHKIYGRSWTAAIIGGIISAGILVAIIPPQSNESQAPVGAHYIVTAGAVVTGLIFSGFIGGLITNQISWRESIVINGDQNIYLQHLKEIKHYSFFPEKAPPEIFRRIITSN